MDTVHTIYILDTPNLKKDNVNFLTYISSKLNIIKNMGVKVRVVSLLPEQLDELSIKNFLNSKNIKEFPVLVTDVKTYHGLREIITIYANNINEYNKYQYNMELQKQKQMEIQKQVEKRNQMNLQSSMQSNKQREIIDDDDHIHNYISEELQIKNKDKDDEEENPFGEINSNSMMDTYRHMMTRRNTNKKNPFSSKTRVIEEKEQKKEEYKTMNSSSVMSSNTSSSSGNMQDIIYNQLQNSSNNNEELREDNIKSDNTEVSINIDTSNIDYDDDDPSGAMLEKAYWSRNSEST